MAGTRNKSEGLRMKAGMGSESINTASILECFRNCIGFAFFVRQNGVLTQNVCQDELRMSTSWVWLGRSFCLTASFYAFLCSVSGVISRADEKIYFPLAQSVKKNSDEVSIVQSQDQPGPPLCLKRIVKNWTQAIAGTLLTLKAGLSAGMLLTAIYRSNSY